MYIEKEKIIHKYLSEEIKVKPIHNQYSSVMLMIICHHFHNLLNMNITSSLKVTVTLFQVFDPQT